MLEIVYLYHSGFAVKTENYVLIFDYYQDSAGVVKQLLNEDKQIIVFSSHRHADHFTPAIATWQERVSAYVLSDDIPDSGSLSAIVASKKVFMKPYQTKETGAVTISTYGSTDEGVSFLAECDGWRIFHAGDLNWWHWKGDTPENIRQAEIWFKKEMDLLAGQQFDVAFFPVDSRLEEYWDIGATEFCRRTTTRQFVAMHTSGRVWIPKKGFPGLQQGTDFWCPSKPGEQLHITKK